MKFTDGYWQMRPGVEATYASQVYDIVPDPAAGSLTIDAPARAVTRRNNTINDPLFTITLSAPMPGVIGVRIEHFAGSTPRRGFDIASGGQATGQWTNYLTGETVTGGSWRTEAHGFDSLPLDVREGSVLPIGAATTGLITTTSTG